MRKPRDTITSLRNQLQHAHALITTTAKERDVLLAAAADLERRLAVSQEISERRRKSEAELDARFIEFRGFVADEVTRMQAYGAHKLAALFEGALRRAQELRSESA